VLPREDYDPVVDEERERSYILGEIRRLAMASDGVAPGIKLFASETGIREHEWRRYWPRWSIALEEAGLAANSWNQPKEEEAVLGRLAAEVRALGRMPTTRERDLLHRQDQSFPSEGVFRRMGSGRALARKLAAYCRDRPDLASVLAVAEASAAVPEASREERVEEAVPYGFVYLMKSGRYYKMGRSNSVGRREYELAIQLPEPIQEIHRIRTDDPTGVERYWHQRFTDRHKNGEWFELTAADVRAFRRWKIA
jgi:hypothetical protein